MIYQEKWCAVQQVSRLRCETGWLSGAGNWCGRAEESAAVHFGFAQGRGRAD
tara:strand:+ start:25806 stop:25961 length:156 start_codon:yes stop_codon:yes gene_type:complete